ncbi:hypothetical protein [Amaricoccus sp. W119]|uniref:hypothetical protein n=1 Tax=Amaricoccus sp. W119 TaxID=3391833 RepID=UPI0039A6922E
MLRTTALTTLVFAGFAASAWAQSSDAPVSSTGSEASCASYLAASQDERVAMLGELGFSADEADQADDDANEAGEADEDNEAGEAGEAGEADQADGADAADQGGEAGEANEPEDDAADEADDAQEFAGDLAAACEDQPDSLVSDVLGSVDQD